MSHCGGRKNATLPRPNSGELEFGTMRCNPAPRLVLPVARFMSALTNRPSGYRLTSPILFGITGFCLTSTSTAAGARGKPGLDLDFGDRRLGELRGFGDVPIISLLLLIKQSASAAPQIGFRGAPARCGELIHVARYGAF